MDYKQPNRQVKLCWTVYTLVSALIPLTVSVVLFRLPMLPLWIPRAFTALWVSTLALLLTFYYPLRYRRMRYALNKDTITAVRGVLFVTRQQMPLAAVRHITAVRGPLERLTGICALFVRAAGGQLLLEGIPADEADELMQALL